MSAFPCSQTLRALRRVVIRADNKKPSGKKRGGFGVIRQGRLGSYPSMQMRSTSASWSVIAI
jgi:hypothetical protein